MKKNVFKYVVTKGSGLSGTWVLWQLGSGIFLERKQNC